MKRTIALPLLITVIILTTDFIAAGQKAYLHLNNADREERKYATANKNALAEIKNALLADNAKITYEDSLQLKADLPFCKWAWESKDGTPDNDKAIVVVNKLYDIGANKIKKPTSVTVKWVITLAENKKSYIIRVQNVISYYGKKSKTKTGYSTGIWEENVKVVVK